MVEAVERISYLIVYYAIFEDLYLRQGTAEKTKNQLSKSLVNLYAAILSYLSKVRRYYDRNTASMFICSLFVFCLL